MLDGYICSCAIPNPLPLKVFLSEKLKKINFFFTTIATTLISDPSINLSIIISLLLEYFFELEIF